MHTTFPQLYERPPDGEASNFDTGLYNIYIVAYKKPHFTS